MAELAWHAGMPVVKLTPLQKVCDVLSAGQFDGGYSMLAKKLADRSCHTVGDLCDRYGKTELLFMLAGLTLPKHGSAYLAGLSHMIHHKFVDSGLDAKARGGNMSVLCTKLPPNSAFNSMRYTPDGRVYRHTPTRANTLYLSRSDEMLLLDCLWIEAQANPELSYGQYLPDGMARRLASVHHQLGLPPFKPFHHKTTREKPRPVSTAIQLTFQNHRQLQYKRIVLDELFKDHFGPKVVGSVRFVPHDSVELDGNLRNSLMRDMVGVYNGTLPVPSWGQHSVVAPPVQCHW